MYQSIPKPPIPPPGQSPGIWFALSSAQWGIWPKMRPARWGIWLSCQNVCQRSEAKGFRNSEAREWRHDSDKSQTNKWWTILKISLKAKAGVPKTLVKQKLRLHSLYFPQKTLLLTESRGEFSDLHSIFRLCALRYSLIQQVSRVHRSLLLSIPRGFFCCCLFI